MTTRWRFAAAAAALLATAAVAMTACGGGDAGPTPVSAVRFAAPSDTLSAGITRTYPAIAYDAGGTVLGGRAVAYASSDPARATVDPAGAVTGVTPGAVTITATSEGRTATLALDVRPAPPARIALAGVDSALVGDAGTLTATVYDATGAEYTSAPVTLTSSDTLVARVDDTGRVTAVADGTATLTAQVTAPSGRVVSAALPYVVLAPVARLRVFPSRVDEGVGASTGLVPVALDAAGNRLSRRVTFASSNGTAARVGAAAGGGAGAQAFVEGLAAGAATVTATSNFRGRDVATATIPVQVAPVAAGGFRIELRYGNSVNPAYAEVFERAAAFWQSAITAPLPAASVVLEADDCGAGVPAVRATTTGVIIYVRVDSVDGPGKVLGAAGPCDIRETDGVYGLTTFGTMRLDSADVGGYVRSGLAYDVIRHEMGHVLGIGTLWNYVGSAARTGTNTPDVAYTGPAGVEGSATLGYTEPGAPAPVENQGGGGTANAHWREAVYGNELMTGYINPGGNPASRLTIQSLADLGYAVNPAAAEALLPPGLAGAAARGPLAARLSAADGTPLVDVVLPPLFAGGPRVPGGRPRRLATPASPLR